MRSRTENEPVVPANLRESVSLDSRLRGNDEKKA
jgi:hypothetical protein